jgi:hypothetical protein
MRFNEFRDPADREPAYDKDFKQDSLFNQLGKVLDSQGNPKPVDTITTDDNKQFRVTVVQAQMLRNLMTSNQIKPALRLQFTKDVQGSNTLAKFLGAPDMVTLFGQMYMNVDDGGAQEEQVDEYKKKRKKPKPSFWSPKPSGKSRPPAIKGGPKTGPTANVALAN